MSRQPSGLDTVSWDTAGSAVDGADAVVNLAGVSIGSLRWTHGRKEAIRRAASTRPSAGPGDPVAKKPPGVSSRRRASTMPATPATSWSTRRRLRELVSRAGLRRVGGGGGRGADPARGGSQRPRGRQRSAGNTADGAAVPLLRRRPGRRRAAMVPLGAPRRRRPPLPARDRRRVARGPLDAVAPEQLRQRDAARASARCCTGRRSCRRRGSRSG